MSRGKHRKRKNKNRKHKLARSPIVNTMSQEPHPPEMPDTGANAQQPTREPRPRSTLGEIFIAIFVAFTAAIYIVLTCVSVASMHIDQRAWVGPVRIGEMVIQADKPGFASMIITNSGKTPALNVTSTMTMSYGLSSTPIEDIVKAIEPNSAGDTTRDVIFPGVINPLPADT